MPSYGLLSTGFAVKPLEAILDDFTTDQRAGISPTLNTDPDALIGILNGIFGQAVADGWLLGLALYNGEDPDQATGDQLAGLSLLTGTVRNAATKTQIVGVSATVAPGFDQLPGAMFASLSGDPTALFTNKSEIKNTTGGNIVVTSDWEAVNAGPIVAPANTLTVISQAITGWISVNNLSAGVTGSAIQTDAGLRAQREIDLSSEGAAYAAAIQADVIDQMQPPTTTSDTLSVTVLWNDTDAFDANGLPPGAIEVIAYQPGNVSADDQALCNLIASSKTAGIGTYSGNATSKTVVDSQNISETIYYTRPTPTVEAIAITVLTDPTKFPSDGVAQIQAAITAYTLLAWLPGATVYYEHTRAQAFAVLGVLDVPVFTIGGGTVNIVIGPRNLATVGTITVTVT